MKPDRSDQGPSASTCQLILCTCPDEGTAKSLSRALVTRELAACVNIVPSVQSVYRWENQVLEDCEVLLLIKTVESRYTALEAAITELHPYDVPEIIALGIDGGSRAYTNWLVSCVSPKSTSDS